jgi:hypothetical protein
MSDAVMARVEQLGIDVDVGEQQTEEEYGRYVSVGE